MCVCCCVVSVVAGAVLAHVTVTAALRCSVRRLSVFLCGGLSDADVQCLASFSALTAVDVGGCHGLTDEALRSIGSVSEGGRRRPLQWLSLYWCPGLSDNGINQLSAGLDCAALTHLSLRSQHTSGTDPKQPHNRTYHI